MSIIELYTVLLPLINVLGTLCLITLVAGGTVFVIVWIFKTYWKYILALGATAFVVFLAVLILGAV